MNKKRALAYLFLLASLDAAYLHAAGADAASKTVSPPPSFKTMAASGSLRFEFADRIRLPQYKWPRTLLEYPVRFEGSLSPEQLRLTDLSTGKEVPFQLSSVKTDNGALRSAVVSFFSELPSGGKFGFELSRNSHATFSPGAKVLKDSGSLVLDAGKLAARIPSSIDVPVSGGTIHGPVMSLRQNGSWIGESVIKSPSRKILSLKTEVLEEGPLFAKARIFYSFEGGASYTAVVRAVSGYDFVELQEEMKGLRKEDGVVIENAWTGFHADRHGNVALGKQRVNTFRGEDPAFDGPTRIENPEKELLLRLEITPANGGGGRQEISFTDEKAGRELGFFIQDVGKWNDREYAIWVSHDTLFPVMRHAGGTLYWDWPLVDGTRATGLAITGVSGPAKSAQNETEPPESLTAGQGRSVPQTDEKAPSIGYLRHLYGDTSLNRVKDWILEYPENAKRPPIQMGGGRSKDVPGFEKTIASSSLKNAPAGEYGAVSMRDLYGSVFPDFLKFRDTLSKEQRESADALLLFSAYYMSEEGCGPMRTMLGGHPNFMSDMKFPLVAVSALFPDHPMAPVWRDQYEKFLELAARFNTRPPVPTWESKGGRWTESLATYNWAFLHPALLGNSLGVQSDFRNRMANPWFAMHGDYLLNTVTAPVSLDASRTSWPSNTELTPENGFQRIHPPQGAHSGKRGNAANMREFAGFMERYDPLLAEHLRWAARVPAQTEAASAKHPAASPAPEVAIKPLVNPGTNPHLRSSKYTGYGMVMRAAVGTPDEISVYLQQVDKGPNYRWGYANQNGSGDIYYYAGGKSYSGHGFEDTGDRHGDDAMYSCNTGVYKDYHYKCIGMNGLVRPFYDLGTAQFAELVPEEGPAAYSWPEYRSRSVLLAGSDYIVVYDAIDGWSGTRFVWTSNGVHDEMPNIIPIKGGAENVVDLSSRLKNGSKGTMWDVWKGGRSRMTVVSHKPEIQVIRSKKGEDAPYVHLKTPTGEDWVFQNDEWQDPEFNYSSGGMSFAGRAGIIRRHEGGLQELALFHGKSIGFAGLTASVDNPELGIGLLYAKASAFKGKIFSREGGNLTLSFAEPLPANSGFFVDGVKTMTTASPGSLGLTVKLPPGEHRIQLCQGDAEPMRPVMLRTINAKGGAKVIFTEVPGAAKYRIELSRDAGNTWQPAAVSEKGEADIGGLTNGTKVHVRAVALSPAGVQSEPADEYPVYLSDTPPPSPDGLRVDISTGTPVLSWGEVLGAGEYHLYRKEKGAGAFREIFHGSARSFEDKETKVPKADSEPGVCVHPTTDIPKVKIYEYAVAASNGNGLGNMSETTDTDPSGWRNWNPDTDLTFKRRTGYWRWPYVKPEEEPPLHYPGSVKDAHTAK
jgi:hypothetical protein